MLTPGCNQPGTGEKLMETGAAIGKGKNQTIKTHTTLMNKKDIVAKVIQFLVTVLSAVLTTFGLQGTM